MKRLLRNPGFTLVELLIVIAILAIISTAVLATIDPAEQIKRARDSAVRNDAVEVLTAYQRYSISHFSFPWMDVDGQVTINSMNTEWFGRSDDSGAGLCSSVSDFSPDGQCDSYNLPGLLVTSREIKSQFLSKGYTSMQIGDPKFDPSEMGYLWIDKKFVFQNQLDAIFVCYIPQAKINRLRSIDLYRPVLNVPQNKQGKPKKNKKTNDVEVVGFERTTDHDFTGDLPKAKWDFKTLETSLYKCVP